MTSPTHLTTSPTHLMTSPTHLMTSPTHLTTSPVDLGTVVSRLVNIRRCLSIPEERMDVG